MKNFVKLFVALVTGDSAEAKALKALNQAEQALRSHISALNFETGTFKDAVESATEALNLKRINGGDPVTSKEGYVRNLLDAKNNVTSAEEELKKHEAKIAFLQSELDALGAE